MNFNEDFRMIINGELVAGEATIEVVNPATGQPFATAPDCSPAQLDAAVAAARAAFKTWRRDADRGAPGHGAAAGERLIAATPKSWPACSPASRAVRWTPPSRRSWAPAPG